MVWEIASWKLFNVERMIREMDLLWDSIFGEVQRRKIKQRRERSPTVDISETKEEIVVKAEISGMDSKDIDISLSDGVLTIEGEKKQERKKKEENYHLIEGSYRAFTHSVQLPRDVQGEKIRAAYRGGVLEVMLPKSERTKKKGVKIKIE